ncbi:unnamed protein product [Plutella xylostella]|uniref:Hemolin n=1 Tax=Plutella xylostella TaxID=51655 RepID=A0A8S4FXJ4_PLUXY|nr:unnamed protein product [Plutella xylostella]
MGTDLGVPQGSSLSNIIFSLLMNDLPNSIPDAQVTMYADDVAATVTGSSVDDLERRLCLVAGQLAHWFQANGLALNPKKTQVMLFNLAGRRSRPLQVKVGSEDLFQVDTSCFLGFKVDCGLSWSDHIDWLCGRLGGACFALQRLAGTVPREVARSCYFATIQSLLTYGIELWGRAADWHRAFVMQKRAVRAMARIKSDESARQYFVSLEILTCPSLYILSVALFVRKNLHLYKECRGARRRGQLLDVQHRLARSQQSVYVCGPGIYNKLRNDVKSMQTLQGFKYKLKKWLATQAFYTDLADDLGDDKGIAEHLKLPIQRINDYQLLLKELVKYSKRLNEDCTDLQKALELFLGVPNRATDNKFIASIEGYRGNIYKLGRLLTHDWFTILDSEGKAKERYLFLFKARILVCKVKRVSDDRSVFVLKDIIKLPEVEVKDHPEGNKFELHIPELPGPLVLTARKETVKTTWLEEIRQHSSDVVALAEHAADDLQLEEPEPEPEEKRKKREHEEDSAENKRVKVDIEEVLTREESLQQLKAKRKASIEKAEVAKKISKTELSEISAIHEVQEISSTVVTSEVTNKTSSDIEIKSSVTEVTTLESTQIEGQSRRQSDSTVDSVETVKIREIKVDQSALEENKFEQSSVEESKLDRQYSVEEKRLEQSTAEDNKVEQSSVEESKVELSSIEAIKVEQSSVEASKVEQSSIEASRITQSSLEKTKLSTEEQASSLSISQEQKSQESVRRKSEQSAEHISEQIEQRRKSEQSLDQKSEQQFQQSSELVSQQSIQQKSAKQSEQSFEQVSQQSIQQKSEEIVQQVSTTEQKSEQLIQQTSEQTLQQASTKQQLSEQSVLQSSEQKSEHLVEQTSGSVRQETISEQKVSSEKTTVQSTVEQKTTRVIEETSSVTSSSVEKSSVQESVIASVTESQASKVESGQAREEAKEVEQTVTEGENGGDEMSRYNRSSRLSGDYSSARSGSRYESSSYESTGLSSTYSRRESGSRRESSKYESESSLEGVASSRYESSSKYESASAKLANGSSKYGIESSYSTNGGQIEGSANSYESYSSSKALANGSITTGESAAIRSLKTESADGKPHFSVTLEGQNIEPGENAFFQCALSESSEKVKVTWLKDNRPFPDILMDRCTITTENGVHKMELLHCREDDTGVYTARAENVKGNTHCTAQLVVQTLTAEERRQKNALNMPYFLVALTDTEILENTYLRFMVKVKGDPNPDVTFFHDGKEIRASSAEKIDIIRTLADRGCYELVIADVTPAHAGTYSCKAINIYGDVTCDAKVTVVDDKNIFGELPPGGEGLLARGEKPAFTWKRDGEPFDPEERFKVLLGDDEDSLALVFQHVKPEDAGLYTCVAKTSTGNISCSAELTVQGAVNHLYREPEKPTLVIEHREAIASAGGSAMLELQCKGFPKPELQFKHDGKVIEADARHKYNLHLEAIASAGGSAMLELQCKGFPKPELQFKHDGKVIEADARHKFLYEDEESMSLVIKNVTSADAGVYEVLATNELGTDNTEIKLVVKAAPKIKQKIENQTCLMGESHTVTIEIEGTPTPEVSFFKDGVEIKASDRILIVKESEEVYKITIKDAKLTDTGSYSVVAKNEINQSSDFWQWQVVTPPKVLKKMGKEKIVEESETVTLEIKTEAEPAPEVKWFKNKVELVESSSVKFVSEGQAHSLVITSASRADAGEYSCEIRNTHGSVTDSSHVRVRAGPIFTERMTNKSAKEGDKNIEFTVSVEAYPEPTIKWYQGDVEITEKKSVFTRVDKGSSHKLILKEISAELSGTYKCKVTNELGEDSCEATFTVNRKPRITKSLVDMTVNAGQTLTLDVEVEGCPDPKVKWFKDGKEVNVDARIKIERDTQRLENYHLTVNLVKEEDGGEYEVRAENEMGSVSCKSTVTVHTKEIHSRLIEEVLENALDDEHKPKQGIVEELDTGTNQKALKGKTEAEIAEEKSFWDDDEDGNSKKTDIKEIEKPVSFQAQKSVTEPDIAEEKSFWDEIDEEPKQSNVKDVNTPQATKAKKSITEPEVAEEKSLWDENANEKKKAVQEEEILNNKQVGSKGLTEPETIENKSIEDDLSPKRKSVKKEKLEESLSAESEGPAETHTIHKMTSTSMCYENTNEEDDDFDDYGGRKLIQPNVPHKTTLEVEEIASHSYYLTEMGHYSIPDFVRRGTYGIIEEPTDSEVDNNSRCGRQHTNRTISIMSVSEDESWQNEPLSREISIEDLSKSIFDIDDTKKVYSKDSYVRRTSFQEEYVAGDGEAFVVEEKTHQVFENDVTEKIKNISQEFDKGVIEIENKIEDIQNRIIEELVMRPMKNMENITKNETETTVEKRRNNRKLECVHEEDDEEIEALIRRSQRQRSILDDILTREDETKAPPSVKESNFKDKHVYESLPLVYTVEATGFPAPTVRWLHEGKEVKNGKRIKVINEGDVFKLEIPSLEMEDGGKWQCEIINDVGKKVLKADLSVDSVNEFRKPIFTSPLEAQRALQREPATFRAVCTADPLPHVSWLLNGELLMPSASTKTTEESKETEHGLKECTYTLHIPSGHHTDTGEYTIQAKNQYGVGESSARLDIMLKPEIEGLADINAQPFEERSFVAVIHANPIAEVKWIKDGVQVLPSSSSNLEIVEDRLTETFKLTVKKVEIADGGVYTLTAKNELGETSKNATLSILTGEPVFTKPLQKQAVKDFDTCTLKVRADGVPKPDISWYREGELVTDDERHQVTTEVAGQVDSQLEIKEFCAGDAGKYMVRATNLVSEAVCEAVISLDQSTPGFTHKLERQKDVDEGEPILLSAKLQGSPRPTATWFKDGIEIPKTDPHITQVHLPDGTVKLSIEHAAPTDCGAYKLQISNPNGDYTALCAVAVNPTPRKPSFSQDLEDQKTTVGQPLKLQATIMAYPAPEVKWFKDGVPIRPSQAVNFINQPGGLIGLSIDACRPEDAGVYSLTVANKLGEVQSKATVEVSQREKKPAFIAELQPATVIEGFPARLEVKVLGHPPPTIKWTHNGKEIVPDGTHLQVISKPDGSQALLIDKATAADAGEYAVVAVNDKGEVASKAQLSVAVIFKPDGSQALLIDKATAADAGEYAVVAVNDKGEVASKAQLSVAGRTDDSVPQERPQLIHGLRDMTAEEGQPLALGAAYVGNPVPDVTWTKDGVPLVQADDVSIVCHGNRVGLEISPCAMSHAGVYSVKLVNPLGEDESSATVAVRKVYQPPSFSQKFTDLQQLPTFDAKFPARVQGVPAPDITWLKDGQPVREGEKYHIKRDGDAVCLYVRDVKPEDSGKYSCVARNREGEDSCAAQLEVVDTIRKRQKMEPPYFLKKIGDTEVYRGMSAKFTACAAGSPEPDVEW